MPRGGVCIYIYEKVNGEESRVASARETTTVTYFAAIDMRCGDRFLDKRPFTINVPARFRSRHRKLLYAFSDFGKVGNRGRES